MSQNDIGQKEIQEYLAAQEEKLKRQYRGVMICQQPERWQYSIEQINLNEPGYLKKQQMKKELDPLLIKQEKKLLKDFKKVRLQNQDTLAQLQTINYDEDVDHKKYIKRIERCSSVITNRTTKEQDKFQGYKLQRGISYFSASSDQQSSNSKRSISTNQQRTIQYSQNSLSQQSNSINICQNQGIPSLKQKFDDYNRAIAEMNKQKDKRIHLPNIFEERKQQQQQQQQKSIEIIRSTSCNGRRTIRQKKDQMKINNLDEQYYKLGKQEQVKQSIKEQSNMMKRIIQNKLDIEGRNYLCNNQSEQQYNMEVIDPISISQFEINITSPSRSKRKIKSKRNQSAKNDESYYDEYFGQNLLQQKMEKDIKKILQNKSELSNHYFKFMSQLKV